MWEGLSKSHAASDATPGPLDTPGLPTSQGGRGEVVCT